MNAELTNQLATKYPQIFKMLGGNPQETCMAWGIACGDGWYDILDRLCQDLMNANPPEGFRAEQIKEKFGGLRFYITYGNDEIFRLINEAEEESYKTCETCGSKENVTVDGSWIQTLCASCRSPEEEDECSA